MKYWLDGEQTGFGGLLFLVLGHRLMLEVWDWFLYCHFRYPWSLIANETFDTQVPGQRLFGTTCLRELGQVRRSYLITWFFRGMVFVWILTEL